MTKIHPLAERVAMPLPGSINTKIGPARVSTMRRLGLMPTAKLSTKCQTEKASARVQRLLETRDVGPFRVTGLKPFLDVLEKMFADVKKEIPELYAVLGTAGVLCVRLVRGSKSTPSNHCAGTAIDIKIAGILDNRGDGLVQKGLLKLYSIAKRHRLFWGAGFPTEDGMHFEASEELLHEWELMGLLK